MQRIRRNGDSERHHERIQRLIDRCVTGDVRAFELLVTEYYRPVHAYAARMVGAQAAEDVAQDVFLRMYRSLDTFRGDASFTTWLFRITHNVCIDYRRRRKNEPLLSLDGTREGDVSGRQPMQAVDEADPHRTVEVMELHEMVQRALARLSDKHRAVLVLHDMHGFRYDEIKDIVGCSLGTVRSRLHYARRALKKILQESFQDDMDLFFEEQRGGNGAAGGAPSA